MLNWNKFIRFFWSHKDAAQTVDPLNSCHMINISDGYRSWAKVRVQVFVACPVFSPFCNSFFIFTQNKGVEGLAPPGPPRAPSQDLNTVSQY